MKKYALLAIVVAILAATGTTYAQKPNMGPETHNPVKFDSDDEALDTKHGRGVAAKNRPLLNVPSQSQSNNRPDGALQMGSGPLVNTVDTVNFDGVAANGFAPPDTSMAVGLNDVVQWVNTGFAIYDKQGNMRAGYPKPGNAFWQTFGGACETQNGGDPIIQYDTAANRWIASQFTSDVDASGNYYQCLAISETADPGGAYRRYAYAFNASTDGFPDDPKITVWKNAYFASYNMFNSTTGGWIGPRICAYDRAAMLAGTSAVQECFDPGASYGSLVPADLDGGSAFVPPSNTGYFLDFGNNSLLLWRFTPDFVTPANATLIGPISLPAASFSMACGGGTCIPQLSTTQKLDSLADRLMYRLAYRNFGDHEAMVVNQSVTAGTSVGIRWYEVRNPLTNPSIYQQGTYAPDATYRWMGSAAMDKVGNIAVGYSASSSSVQPGIRYTGRETGDPLGTLQAEQIIITGGRSQTGGLSRWGDYSAMRIDPADDCTFWYTSGYIPTTGSVNWHTRIASFRFDSCANTSDFTIGATPSSQTVVQGNGTSYTVNLGSVGGFSNDITLNVPGLPTATPTSYARNIAFAIDHTQVGGSDLTNFNVVVRGTFPDLRSVANGGLIQNVPGPPADFVVSPNPDGSSKYNFEIADYDATTGYIEVYFGVPTVSASVDGTFYFAYDDPTVTTYQGSPLGGKAEWDANYKAVYHFGYGWPSESTNTHAEGNVSGATLTTGVVGDALNFAGGSDVVDVSLAASGFAFPNYARPMTFEFWLQLPSGGGPAATILQASSYSDFLIYVRPDFEGKGFATVDLFTASGEAGIPSPTDGAWHHYMFAVNAAGGLVVTFDGVQQSSLTTFGGAVSPNTSTAVKFGNGLLPLVGKLDEVRFSNVARPANWATAAYNNQKVGSTFVKVLASSSPPAITTQPASQTIGTGQTATLSVVATGTAPLTYQWYTGPSGTTTSPISGATGSSYTTPALTTTTSYWVRVSNASGTADSATATITIATGPAITTQPASQTIGTGQTATLTVTATGTAPLTYQWYIGTSGTTTSPISGATASSYTTPALTATTSYWVRVSNASGTANSATATITVTSSPACQDTVTLGYSGGTLNIGFTVATPVAANWNVWLYAQNTLIPLWSVAVPAISPAVSVNVPIPGFPQIGTVYVLTTLGPGTQTSCYDVKSINTGP